MSIFRCVSHQNVARRNSSIYVSPPSSSSLPCRIVNYFFSFSECSANRSVVHTYQTHWSVWNCECRTISIQHPSVIFLNMAFCRGSGRLIKLDNILIEHFHFTPFFIFSLKLCCCSGRGFAFLRRNTHTEHMVEHEWVCAGMCALTVHAASQWYCCWWQNAFNRTKGNAFILRHLIITYSVEIIKWIKEKNTHQACESNGAASVRHSNSHPFVVAHSRNSIEIRVQTTQQTIESIYKIGRWVFLNSLLITETGARGPQMLISPSIFLPLCLFFLWILLDCLVCGRRMDGHSIVYVMGF